MSQLRKEYTKSKQKKEEIVSEAALNWLAENVIIINEALDRKSVKRLINSIQKFEDTFGPFADRVPSIRVHLDAAETGLELVITGRSSDRKTSNLLKQMTYLYSTLSGFFAKDLPILLKSRFFRAAKEQPDQRMDMLPSASPGGHKHNPQIVQDAIATALKPSKEEKKLLGKMYRATKLPELQPKKIARELMSLSYNDLKELTNIGKVPMVATPEELGDTEAPEQEVAAESAFRGSNQLLTEGILTEASVEEVGPVLQQALQIVKGAGLQSLVQPLDKLYSELINYMGSSAGEQLKAGIQQAKSAAGAQKGTALADIFKTPGGKLLKQANMAIETLKALGQAWPDVQDILNKPNVTAADLTNIESIIAKKISGGFFKKAAQSFGITTQPYPGLKPEEIIDALGLSESVLRGGGVILERPRKVAEQTTVQDDAEAQAAAEDPRGGTNPDLAAPDLDAAAAQKLTKLKNAMAALNQFASGASGTAKTGGSTTTKPTDVASQTNNASSTQGTETAGTGPAGGKEVAGKATGNPIEDLKKVPLFSKQNDQALQNLIASINQAGYQLVKAK